MSRRLAAIQIKRARLIERAARERADIADSMQSWSRPLGLVDRVLAGVNFVLARPPLLAAAAISLVLLRPGRAWKWARRAYSLWRGYRWLANKVAV
jgi:hypothetical protein